MPDEEPPEYGLIMPFVVCATQGGPYEDQAFTAGFSVGRIDALLMNGIEFEGPVFQQLLPQLDLIAMRYGFKIEANELLGGEWAMVRITQNKDAQ